MQQHIYIFTCARTHSIIQSNVIRGRRGGVACVRAPLTRAEVARAKAVTGRSMCVRLECVCVRAVRLSRHGEGDAKMALVDQESERASNSNSGDGGIMQESKWM